MGGSGSTNLPFPGLLLSPWASHLSASGRARCETAVYPCRMYTTIWAAVSVRQSAGFLHPAVRPKPRQECSDCLVAPKHVYSGRGCSLLERLPRSALIRSLI